MADHRNTTLPDIAIMLVDDEPFIRKVVRQVLSGLSLTRIDEADGAESAIAKMGSGQHELRSLPRLDPRRQFGTGHGLGDEITLGDITPEPGHQVPLFL